MGPTGLGAGATGQHGASHVLGNAMWVEGGHPLIGTVSTPGDKSISHRALILAWLAEGTSTIRGLSDGDDVARTLAAVEALGSTVRRTNDGALIVDTVRSARRPPRAPLDFGNSGTGMRLLAGAIAGVGIEAALEGDASLSARPMDRIAEPLRAMGVTVEGRGSRCLPPLHVSGAARRAIDWTPAVPSAQVKSCILLAGLGADGETVVREPVGTRTHTEDMLRSCGVDVRIEPWGAGRIVRLQPSIPAPLDVTVPGDPSQAAFWVVAGTVVPGSRVTVRNVYAGADRTGFLSVLRRMGADVTLEAATGDSADITARFDGSLRATEVDAAEIPSLDEVPALVVAASVAEGTTVFRDMAELRVKESDRLAGAVALAESFGGRAEVDGDELRILGVGPRGRLVPGTFDSRGDHRLAMAAAVAAMAAAGDRASLLTGFAMVGTSYPAFADDAMVLGGLVSDAGDQTEGQTRNQVTT
jgi:3-phosphoshikimate 1-carboxyvinyltransferase